MRAALVSTVFLAFVECSGGEFLNPRVHYPREDVTLETDALGIYRMVIGFDADGTPRATIDFARGTRVDPDDRHFSDWETHWANAEHVELPFRSFTGEEKTILPAR